MKTRYLVVNKEILDEHPDFLVEGAATVSQRLAITGTLAQFDPTLGSRLGSNWWLNKVVVIRIRHLAVSNFAVRG